MIRNWYDLIKQRTEDLASTMTQEQGKPLSEARGEINYANGFMSWYAEEGKRIYGEIIPTTQQNKRLFVHKQPVGVAAVITPWNFPAAMITRRVGLALAAGCTVVIKPAGQTPLTAIKLIQLAKQAGIIGLNDGLPSTPQAPFGGFKQSGLGREGSHHGIDECIKVKYISLRL